jgi:hypothetical protein
MEHVPRIAPPPDLLSVEVIQAVGSLVAGRLAERVLVAFLGWLAMMRKGDGYWYKASSITKYVQNVRRIMEQRCGMQFGSGGIPALVQLPRSLLGTVAHRNEGTLPRLVVAPQHLLAMCAKEGVALTARRGQGPLVTFAQDFAPHEKHDKLCLLGACSDGFLLAMRRMEFLSTTTKFDPLTALSRADVMISADGSRGVMHVKRYKGDKRHNWPAKVFSPAIGGVLCALAIRLEYGRLNPVPAGSDPAAIPYWQLPSGTPLTRARLQTFLQMHMKAQGAPEKYYKSHSLRKGGVTALLAAGVPLPQIQLMARWVSPNMAELYASLTTKRLDSAFSCLGVMSSLDVVAEESRFWTACTTRPG